MIVFAWYELVLISVGVTLTLTQGSLFAWLQTRWSLFRCGLCLGWWVGLAVWLACRLLLEDCTAGRLMDGVLVPPVTALASHVAGNFVAACYRVATEPYPGPPILEEQSGQAVE